MKKILSNLKEMIPSFILTFALCFMLFVYEPITLYANNIEDFWFDIYIIIGPILLIFLIAFLGISVFLIFANVISKKFFKKLKIYEYCLLALFIVFIYLYIQGNYLIGSLPVLDGETFTWSEYSKQDIISMIIIAVLLGSQVILILKLGLNKCINIVKYVSLSVVAMLITSLVSTMLTTDLFVYKSVPIAVTNKNINTFSKNNNFIIIVLDSVDSMYFYDILKDSDEYKNIFDDFTYYPDTMSTYAFTRDSIPFILTGEWYENNMSFLEHSTNSLNNSKLLKTLKDNNYDINLYTSELIWEYEKVSKFSNVNPIERKAILSKFFKQELKYILFKYLPYRLKNYSKIETMDFNFTKMSKDIIFDCNNIAMYNVFNDIKSEVVDENKFKFIHLEGGHIPFNQDEELNIISDGTYDQKLLATLKVLEAYLNNLKESEVYDNSIIMIMSDHGYNLGDYVGRQNPILFIKGFNEHHSKMKESDKAISFDDLQDAYLELLEGKTSREIFSNIGTKRKRRFILYENSKRNYMYEYIQTGKAWDEDTMVATGKEYILR